MISDSVAAALARRNIHYGWVVAAVTFLTMLVSAGAIGAPGVFILPLQKEFGWTTAEISSALATRLLLFGLMAPFAAALINRFGVRRMMLTAMGIVIVSLLLSLAMTSSGNCSCCGASPSASAPASLPSCSARPSLRAGSISGVASSSAC